MFLGFCFPLQLLLVYYIRNFGNSTECNSEQSLKHLFACWFVYLKSQIQDCAFPHTPALDLDAMKFFIAVHITLDKSGQQAPYEIQQGQMQSLHVGSKIPSWWCTMGWPGWGACREGPGSLGQERASSTRAGTSWQLRRPWHSEL